MKFDFEKLKKHKKYDVFYDLIKEMQKTKECSIFLNNSEVILTHIIGMFIENSADIQHDIERLNQQEKLSDKVLNGFRNVYDDITKAKSNKSLTNTTKDGIFNGLNIICNWLLFRESISYMTPLKNYGKGCAALKELRDRAGASSNKKEIKKNIDLPVEEESEYEKLVKKKIQEYFDEQDAELKSEEESFRKYINSRSDIRHAGAYLDACIENWKWQNHYHDYETVKAFVVYDLNEEWRELMYDGFYEEDEDDDLGWRDKML